MRHAVVASLFLFAAEPAAYADDLDVVNQSATAIHHLYLSPTSDTQWGPGQIRDFDKDVVEPGDAFTLTAIEDGRFGLKVVAKDDTDCEGEGAKFNEGKRWVISERILDDCSE